MKQKKKILITAGVVAASLFAVFCIVFILIGFFSDIDSEPNEQEIAEYNRLAENYAHFTGSFIEIVPIDELDIPVPGVDYYPEDVVAAFEELHGMTESDGSSPGYTEVVRNPENIGILNPTHIRPTPGPDAWAGLGDIIVEQITDQYDDYDEFIDSGLYWVLSDPAIWIETGDFIISSIALEIDESDVLLDTEFWGTLIIEAVNSVAEEVGIEEDFYFLDDVITEYLDEQWGDMDAAEFVEYTVEYFDDSWNDYRENPVQENIPESSSDAASIPNHQTDEYGRILAEFYPIKYKAAGRLFYRETLNEKQKIVYDIAVTAIQAGLFSVECNFGISVDEARDAIEAVRIDFPEFFYLEGMGTSEMTGGIASDLDFGLHRDVKAIGVDRALSQVAEYVNPIVSEAQRLNTQIDKVKYIVDHMVKAISYPRLDQFGVAPSGKNIGRLQTIWSAVADGETVCAGYSSLFHYYMKLLGISATTLSGGSHGWNLLELDGEYYLMDVTWIDTGESYKWFNFNEDLLRIYAGGDDFRIKCHTPEGLSALLPAAKGTKYGYEKWFGPLEPQPTPETTPYVPPAVSATVVINGYDATPSLSVVNEGGVLYAKGKAFVEAFADLGALGTQRWFDYEHRISDEKIYITGISGGERVLDLSIYSALTTVYENNEYREMLEMSAKVQEYSKEVYIPILAFADALGKAGYEVEIVIDGTTHSFVPSQEPNMPDASKMSYGESPSVRINGVDISSELTVKTIDNVAYAEGKSFIEAIREPDMPDGMHSFDYEYTTENDDIFNLLGNYDHETGSSWIDDEYEYLLDYDAVFVNSYFTEITMYILFLGANEAWICTEVNAGEPFYELYTISEAPRYVDGEVYIPIEAFAATTGYEIVIE